MKKLKLKIQRFSSTNETTHYNLSQYIGTDKPTYLVDYNSDMNKIDTAIYGADSKATQNTNNIGTMSNLNTTEKSNLVGAINEVNTQVETNTGNISTNTSNISTLGTNQGVMTNLTTTEKSNLVGAINEVKAVNDTQNTNIGTLSNLSTADKSNLVGAINEIFSFTDFTIFDDVDEDSIVLENVTSLNKTGTELHLAYNEDKTIFKLYGRLLVQNSGTNESAENWKIKIPSRLRPSQEYTIKSVACYGASTRNTNALTYLGIADAKISTDGTITIQPISTGWALLAQTAFYFAPCIYFNKSFTN